MKKSFQGSIIAMGGGGAGVCMPFDPKETFGAARARVKVTFDGKPSPPYRTTIADMGEGPMVGVLKAVREEIGKGPGDTVKVVVELDTEERTVDVPSELAEALQKNKKAALFYQGLSYTHRKEYARWVGEAKKSETRLERARKAILLLESKKKDRS
jgi:hypothetical protein